MKIAKCYTTNNIFLGSFLPAMHMSIPFQSSVTPNAIRSIDQVWSAIACYIIIV